MTADAPDLPASPIDTLLVIDDDVVARMGSMVRHLCVGMIDEAVQVRVMNWASSPQMLESAGPARVMTLPRRKWLRSDPSPAEVLQLLGGQRPNIVHCMSAALAHRVHAWCAEWQCPLVVHVTDLADVEEIGTCETTAALTVAAISPNLEHALLQRWPRMHCQIRVVPPGLPAQSAPTGLAEPDRVPTAVVTVPLTRDCGLDIVLRALRSIIKDKGEIQLFIMSLGRAERYFRHQVDELGLRPFVTFAGELNNWPALRKVMGSADFLVHPSSAARFTAGNLTALASGLCILAPADTTEDYLIDQQTAALFDPNRPKQLLERWTAMLDDPAAARQLAAAALEYARTRHQASMMVARTAALYRELRA